MVLCGTRWKHSIQDVGDGLAVCVCHTRISADLLPLGGAVDPPQHALRLRLVPPVEGVDILTGGDTGGRENGL